MENSYRNYLEGREIYSDVALEPVLWQVDSLYYERFKTAEYYYVIDNNDTYNYTPIVIPDNYFITELITGQFLRSDPLEDSEIADEVIGTSTTADTDVSEDFKYTLIGNTILVENASASLTIKVRMVYVEKVYDNLLPALKDIFDIILYGMETGDNDSLYGGISKLSIFKKDRKAEKRPIRKRTSGGSVPSLRRTLR